MATNYFLIFFMIFAFCSGKLDAQINISHSKLKITDHHFDDEGQNRARIKLTLDCFINSTIHFIEFMVSDTADQSQICNFTLNATDNEFDGANGISFYRINNTFNFISSPFYPPISPKATIRLKDENENLIHEFHKTQ